MNINNNVRSVGNSLAEICEESDDAGRIAATEAQLDDSAKAKLCPQCHRTHRQHRKANRIGGRIMLAGNSEGPKLTPHAFRRLQLW